MIQLRTRKLPRIHLSTTGSDQEASKKDAFEDGAKDNCIVPSIQHSSQQVLGGLNDDCVVAIKKRGRKPKIRALLESDAAELKGKQIGLNKESGKSVVLPKSGIGLCVQRQIKKRGRKPKSVNVSCCDQLSCNDVPSVSCEQKQFKKRGRKPKCKTIETDGNLKYASVSEEISNEKIKAVGQRKLSVSNAAILNDVLEPGCVQNSEAARQAGVKRRGRKPKSQISIKCDVPNTGQKWSCVSDAIPKSGSSVHGQVMGCNSAAKEPGNRKGNPELHNRETVKRLKAQTAQQRSIISNVSNKTGDSSAPQKCKVKNVLPEPRMDQHAEEKNAPKKLACLKMELRNSRKNRSDCVVSHLAKEVPYSAEKNTQCLTQTCDPCMLKDEQKTINCIISEKRIIKCPSKTCCTYTPNLPNPTVRLQNCKNLHKLHCSETKTIKLEGVVSTKELHMQKQVTLVDTVASNNSSLSENKEVFEAVSDEKKPNQKPRLINLKWKSKKHAQKINVCIEGDDGSSSRSDCGTMTASNEGHQCRVEHADSAISSSSHFDLLSKEINNNNSIAAVNLNLMNEASELNTIEEREISWDSYRTQAPIVSEEEISDQDSIDIKCSTLLRMSPRIFGCSDSPEHEKMVNVSCQRIIPFTGKTIWKCSCARTCVWTFTRKRAADSQNTEILGIEAEKSLEVYPNDMQSLFETITDENLQERTDDIDSKVEGKKRKVNLETIPPLDFNSSICSLDESLKKNDEKEISDVLFSAGQATDSNITAVPLPSDTKSSYENLATSIAFEPNNIQNANIQYTNPLSKNNHISKQPAKSVTILELKPIPKTIFKRPLKHGIEEGLKANHFSLLDNKETSNLHHSSIPILDKDLTIEISSSTSTFLQNSDTGFVMECLPKVPTEKSLERNVPELDDNHNCRDRTSSESVDGTSIIDSHSASFPTSLFDKDDSLKHVGISESPVTLVPISKKRPLMKKRMPDILNVYQEDVLVLDVIQDDPDLFGFSSEEETRFSKSRGHNAYSNASSSEPKIVPLICKLPKKKASPAYESKSQTQRIEDSSSDSCITSNVVSAATENKHIVCSSLPEAHGEDVVLLTEPEKHRDPPEQPDKGKLQEICHTEKSEGGESSSTFREIFPIMRVPGSYRPLLPPPKPESTLKDDPPPPQWIHDIQHNRKDMSPPDLMNLDSREKWKFENPSFIYKIHHSWLPYGYCNFFFNTLYGCGNKQCSYIHIPKQCDEKICMNLLHKLIAGKNTLLLRRAVWIFTKYYSQYQPRVDYDNSIFSTLLDQLLNLSWWQDIFQILETAATAKILPSIDLIIKVFERVSSDHLETALPHLLDLFSKFVDAGLNPTLVEINQILATMNQSNASRNNITILLSMKARFEMKLSKQNWAYDLGTAIAEVEHCKVNSNWMQLGILYLNVCRGCENITDLKNISRCIAEALMKESVDERSEIPYTEFADTIFKNPQLNDIHKNILGRIGITLMYFYHRKELWQKGRRVLHKLKEMQINYTVLKGLDDQESVASRCHVVNIAVEIFLMCGHLINAVQALKESDWIINTTMWPCDRMDVLKRHNLLCTIIQEAVSKSMFTLCFEVLQNLPGLQESQGALSLGFYTLFEASINHKILHIPSFMSDVEMLITIELFMVSNASSIQSPGGCNQILQIVLKRVEEDKAQCKDSYHAATDRLFEASRLSNPRLFIKHMTVNNTNEQVYILDSNSTLKWLIENMKWAGNVWSYH
ncbi:protein TOPAZ1 isoform X2 [Mixophyes fleayi]|uniref:protein TOPAZ1 isoform X2 n=1 Tax=Mixophyes fleayi TaxID=3061075 RepID=UPI003F4E1AEF